MHFFDRCLPTTAENLAVEEAWLDMAEEGLIQTEILRVWTTKTPFVVIGRGSQVSREVNLLATEARGLPVFRRMSGGAAVVTGPGCLMYALLLSYQLRPQLRLLDQAHRTVMETMLEGLKPLEDRITWDGTCDLVVDARKVSGNSLRCRRDWLVYHGTILLDMDLALIDQFLLHPPREPEYRQKRSHSDFVANLGLSVDSVTASLCRAWGAQPGEVPIPSDRIELLVRDRYQNRSWNFQR